MSGGLCPSKSTVYIGNLPFSLTNNDLHKILEKYGKVVKVTSVKDKETHKSKGVAFVLFLEKESAQKCVRALNQRELFGRKLKCSIAKDNGRTTEFIRRKFYTDKSRCYECGELGHLSYFCPKNILGDREPVKKEKKKKFHDGDNHESGEESEEEVGEDPGLESLSAAIKVEQEKIEEEEYRIKVATGKYEDDHKQAPLKKRKVFVKSGYLSDDEEVEES